MATISPPLTPSDSRILDLAYDGIFLLAMDGTVLFWNRGAEEMYGWTRMQAVGRISHDLLRTQFPVPLDRIMEKLLSEGQWSGELVHRTRDGRQITVSTRWALERTPEGEPSGILEIVRDITQAKVAERQQARLAALVESSDDAIITKSLDGVIETWNPGAERLYGYSRKEAVGKPIALIVPPERMGEEMLILSRIRAGEQTPHLETVRLRKDGTAVDVSLGVFPIKDAASQLIGASHVARDISQRKQFENDIRALNDSLEQRVDQRTRALLEANDELESFSYSVSHDLRAPLRAIDGFSRLLLEDSSGDLDEKAAERLQRIRGAATRMGQLIDALLDLARISQADIRNEHIGLSTLAGHIAHELQRTAPNRQVEFLIKPGLSAEGDPRLVRILLENLLGNAFKFTSGKEYAVVEFGQSSNDGQRVFFVKDNGVGFDMEYAGQLFVPFQRLHSPAQFEGTGIGLATVRRIVSRHGGRIWVEAAPESGATFFFTLEPERRLNAE